MSERQSFGKHWLRFEPNGVVFLKYQGDLSLDEINRLAEMMAPHIKVCREEGQDVFIIFDISDAAAVEPGARKFSMQWLTKGDFAGAVNFGGGLLSRTMVQMVLAALRLLHKKEFPLGFVKTEAAARAWVATQRQLLAAKQRG